MHLRCIFSALSSYYYLSSKPKYKENDYQPEEPDDEVVVDMSNTQYVYPKQIKLLSMKKLKCCKIPYLCAK